MFSIMHCNGFGLGLWCFCYIVVVSFIGGGNGVPGENLSQRTLVMICTDCTGSCKSNYHTITTTTTPISMGHTQKRHYCTTSQAIQWRQENIWWNIFSNCITRFDFNQHPSNHEITSSFLKKMFIWQTAVGLQKK